MDATNSISCSDIIKKISKNFTEDIAVNIEFFENGDEFILSTKDSDDVLVYNLVNQKIEQITDFFEEILKKEEKKVDNLIDKHLGIVTGNDGKRFDIFILKSGRYALVDTENNIIKVGNAYAEVLL